MSPEIRRPVSLPAVHARLRLCSALILVLFVLCAVPLSALSQALPGSPPTLAGGLGSLVVQVKDFHGTPLTNAILTLYTEMLFPTGNNPIRRADGFEFQGVAPGRYVVEAIVADFQPARQTVELSGASLTQAIMFFLKPLGAKGEAPYVREASVFTPKAQKETHAALRDLHSKKYGNARKHLDTALKAAPGNATVHYLVAMTYIMTDRALEAGPYLEKALSLDPRHLQSLLALGNLRYQNGDYAGAKELLERALEVSPTSWQAHWMLARCHIRLRDFSSARQHAERAFELGREKAVGVHLLRAEALAGLGENNQAAGVLSAYLQEHPRDADAEKIRGWIADLERSSAASATPVVIAAPLETTDLASATVLLATPSTKDSWVPPDSGAAVPPLVPGVACNLSQVLAGAAKRAEELVTHLEKFSALEYYESVEIGPSGQVANPISAAFDYLAFIRKIRPDLFTMEEVREQNKVARPLPGRILDVGSPAIVLIFYPRYQDDFEMKCEGLGQWNGQATWLVHFQQRADRPVRARNFVSEQKEYPLHLRGRAWISAENFQPVHLETDLLQPIPAIQLRREHVSVDYQLVPFPESRVELWLPHQVDVYYDFRGRFQHNYHRFSDFRLFTVDVTQQIGDTKKERPQPKIKGEK